MLKTSLFLLAGLLFSGPLPAQATELDELCAATEKLRNLSFLEPVACDRLDPASVEAFLTGELDRQYSPSTWSHLTAALSLLGAIPAGFELRQFMELMLNEQVAGFYDPETKRMCVVGPLALESALTRVVLVHELTHALTDQHFGLASLPIESTTQEDRALAALAVVEGDATQVMIEYAASLDLRSSAGMFLMSALADQDVYAAAPPFPQAWLLFPYLAGQQFLLEVTHNPSYEIYLDQVYCHPPESTEQVLHPEKYVSGDDPPFPLELSAAEAGQLAASGEVVWSNTLGEYLIQVLLQNELRARKAEQAAAGWGGDRYYLVHGNRGETGLYWQTRWDTARDADEFRTAMIEFADGQSGKGGVAMTMTDTNSDPQTCNLWFWPESEGRHSGQ